MKSLDRRLADLERAAMPVVLRFVIYQEDLEQRGMYRRGAGWRGRDDLPPLLRHDELAADAGPDATIILITYEGGDDTPVSFDTHRSDT